MEERIKNIFLRKGLNRFIILAVLVLILYLLRSMMNLLLLTFIFTYLMNRFEKFISKRVPINRKITVPVLYVLIVGLLTFGIVEYSPVIVSEITELVKQLIAFYTKPQSNPVLNYVVSSVEKKQITNYLEQYATYIVKYFTDISKFGLQLFMAVILSLFFLLEKARIIRFTQKFRESKLGPFYEEIEYFARKFTGTFGKVIEAQFIIAINNCVLTTIGLWILGFPQLFGLAIMILFLGFIPVAGVIISFIPLGLIAFSIGGFIKVLYVGITIIIVHSIESYVLNPKLMSSKTNLPVFYTFIVLLFSEEFFGIWGLVLGIPVFVFLLDILEVPLSDHKKEI
jgi:predicted PurR-regulated permease PerM